MKFGRDLLGIIEFIPSGSCLLDWYVLYFKSLSSSFLSMGIKTWKFVYSEEHFVDLEGNIDTLGNLSFLNRTGIRSCGKFRLACLESTLIYGKMAPNPLYIWYHALYWGWRKESLNLCSCLFPLIVTWYQVLYETCLEN